MITIKLLALSSMLLSLPRTIKAADCTTSDIVSNSVGGCFCPTNFSTACGQKCNDPYCHQDARGQLVQCFDGCVQPNVGCDACYLYFHSLCLCMKGSSPNCISDGADWWLLNDHKLITTSRTVPGIVQLGSDNGGWELGQTLLARSGGISLGGGGVPAATRQSGTLSVNSALSRDEEQIHIHVCSNAGSVLRRHLDTLTRDNYKDRPTPLGASFAPPGYPSGSVLCQASQVKGAQMDVADITARYLKGAGGCEESNTGAGLITDSNDHLWVCVTTIGDRSAEELFCRI